MSALADRALQEADRALGTRKPNGSAHDHHAFTVQAVELREFLSLQLPERKYLLEPVLPQQGIAMVHGPRGLGKTHLSLGIAYAVASGGTFLRWTAPSANGVLLVDGEMPAVVLQERLARIVQANNQEATAPLRIITPDLNREHGIPDISSSLGQAAIDAHVDESVKLIILDNLSSLARTGVENDAESWQPLQTWALRHRAAGRSVLFIHHSGKGGAQRGTSRREDVLDTVIGLRRPHDYEAKHGARFEIVYEKCRGFFGDAAKPFDAKMDTDAAGRQTWTMTDLEDGRGKRIHELSATGMKPNDIAAELGVSRATVYRTLQKPAPKAVEGTGDEW